MTRAVIFDLNRTLYDPLSDGLYPGTLSMLEALRPGNRLFLYSRRAGDRGDLIARLGIAEHFEGTHFVENKTPENLRDMLERHALVPGECIMVGDLVDAELRVAGEVGMETVWARHGICPIDLPGDSHLPTYYVDSMHELQDLLKVIA